MDKEFDGIHASHLTLAVISGQYVAENVYSFYNAFVEVEILGVPADCRKIRTKVARRNALNPELSAESCRDSPVGSSTLETRKIHFLVIYAVARHEPSASSDRARDKDRPAPSEGHEDTKPTDSYLVCVHNVSHEIPYAILKVFRRLGTRLAGHRASLSSELGSLWEFMRTDRDRRRSAPAGCEPAQPRDTRKFDEKRCPLVKEESDLSSDDGNDRIANLIDFFFTIVKSQNNDRKGSVSSCFRTDSPTESTNLIPRRVNTELEKKMETLMEFLATTGCMDDEVKDESKITLMEFLFGADNKPLIEIDDIDKGMSLSESKINVKLSYIDETPVEESRDLLVDILIKYMENFNEEPNKSVSVTPSLSEKSKSDVTLSKIETFSDISKTKSDSTLTHTQDTVIDKELDSRRISETVVDLSNIKQDLEDIFEQAVFKVCELKNIDLQDDDTMSENEDLDNFTAYTKPPLLYNIYSVELSDILEEDENDPSSRGIQEDRMTVIRECAEDLLDFIEDRVQSHFESDSSSDEFDINPSIERSISLIDLRSIPDLPPSIIRPIVVKVDKSTSTENDSVSDNRRIDSGCMTEDTSLTNSSDKQERVLDKLESLHKFFSRSRLEMITESMEEDKNDKKLQQVKEAELKGTDIKVGQASLDDVEDLQDDFDGKDDICIATDENLVEIVTAGESTNIETAINVDFNENNNAQTIDVDNENIATNEENFIKNVSVEVIKPVDRDSEEIVDPDRCIVMNVENEPIVTNLRIADTDVTDPNITDSCGSDPKVTDIYVTAPTKNDRGEPYPKVTDRSETNITYNIITDPKVTDAYETNHRITDPNVSETGPKVTNLNITDRRDIDPTVTDGRGTDSRVIDANITFNIITDPKVTDAYETNRRITDPKVTDAYETNRRITDPDVTETGPKVTNRKVTDASLTETCPRITDRKETNTIETTEFISQNVKTKMVCQNNDKLEDKINERQGRNISENDFTEIDKIIDEAIKIIKNKKK
ncbi:Phosphoinositide phospholipase C [Operophtera brumata]|uniref:Phosphoinositide phospholipase C n=1 Tax=Operophtera brumata TaxID=104452 RepID=A0A0L7L8M5_OPEBR|nr:Phosphoinositide phospholipase C [Operophtera brumata]